MLELNKVVDEISRLEKSLSDRSSELTRAQEKKEMSKINFLRLVCTYLKTFPSEEFVEAEIKKLNNRRNMINKNFDSWIPTQYFEKEKDKLKEYDKQMGVPKIKAQLRALKFINNK